MTEQMPFAGGTLLIASGPSGDHLFVVVFEPKKITGYGQCEQVLLVPFCSIYPGEKYDPACILQTGDHGFLNHASYVDYRNSRIESVNHIRERIDNKIFRVHDPVSDLLLHRIQQGLDNSARVSRHIKDDFCLHT